MKLVEYKNGYRIQFKDKTYYENYTDDRPAFYKNRQDAIIQMEAIKAANIDKRIKGGNKMDKIKNNYDKMAEIWERHGVFDLLNDRYSKQIEATFIWDNILSELNNPNDDMIVDDEFDDCKYAALYVGSSLSIMPSGKYYLPFACSNIENVREALQDEVYQQALLDKLESLGLWWESGEGDPLDTFFCKSID